MPASQNRISHVMHSCMQLEKLASAIAACALIGALSACAESTPVGPGGQLVEQPTTPPQSPTTTPPPFIEPSSPAHIYQETGPLYEFAYSYHGGMLISRYVLYDDGSFALQFSSARYGLSAYEGTYFQSGSEIRFLFKDANLAGPWEAVGTTDGNKLRVDYNGIMIAADFESGVYLKKPAAP